MLSLIARRALATRCEAWPKWMEQELMHLLAQWHGQISVPLSHITHNAMPADSRSLAEDIWIWRVIGNTNASHTINDYSHVTSVLHMMGWYERSCTYHWNNVFTLGWGLNISSLSLCELDSFKNYINWRDLSRLNVLSKCLYSVTALIRVPFTEYFHSLSYLSNPWNIFFL